VLHPPPPPSGDIKPASVIYSPDPPYPEQARNAGLEGTVQVVLTVGEDGAPRDVRVTQGLEPAIDEGVAATLGQWRFRPALLNGQVMTPLVVVEVRFQLPDKVVTTVHPPPAKR